jgi:hypothetical protein
MQSVGDVMSVDDLFDYQVPGIAPATNDFDVTWQFALTVTDEMRVASRQRNPFKWRAVQGFLQTREKPILVEILETKQ